MQLFKIQHQISTKLVLCVVLTMLFITASFATFTAWRLNKGAQQQQQAIEMLASEQITSELKIETALFAEILKQLMQQVNSNLAAFLARSEIKEAIIENNVVAINDSFNRFVKTGTVDSIIAINADLQTIARHSPKLILSEIDKLINIVSYAKQLELLFKQNDVQNPKSYTEFFVGNEKYTNALGLGRGLRMGLGLGETKNGLFIVAIQPIFNESGKIISLIIANRHISETSLSFKNSTELQLKILFNNKTILTTGADIEDITSQYLTICQTFAKQLEICLSALSAQVENLTSNIIKFIVDEKWAMMKWLFGLCILATIIASILAYKISQNILKPLNSIGHILHLFSQGNWHANINELKQKNEISEIDKIYNAILQLQKLLQKQEITKLNIEKIKKIENQKKQFTTIIEKCRLETRQNLFVLEHKNEISMQDIEKLRDIINIAISEIDSIYIIIQNMDKAINNKPLYETLKRLNKTTATIHRQAQIIKNDLATIQNEMIKFSANMKQSLQQSYIVTKN